MAEKTKVDVLIAGKTYTIIGFESDEYIQRVGHYVDKKMADILKVNSKLSTSGVAVLTAINVADDFFKAHENEMSFKKEIVAAKLETEKLLEDNLFLEEKNKTLTEQFNKLQIEVARREAELAEVRSSRNQSLERRVDQNNHPQIERRADQNNPRK